MPFFINDIKFINKERPHLDAFLETWYGMVEEYTSGAYKEKKMTMSDVYAPNPFLAPMGYGLVVVDYKTNTILDMQSYTSFGRLLRSSFLSRSSKEDIENATALFNSKLIDKIRCYDNREDAVDHFPVIEFDKSMTLEYFMEQVNTNQFSPNFIKDAIQWDEFVINMSPWNIIEFPETSEGVIAFKNKVLELGFILTEKEEELWTDFLEFKKEEENDRDEN